MSPSALRWTHHHFDMLDQMVLRYLDPKNIRFSAKRYDNRKTVAWGHFEAVTGSLTDISHVFGDVLQSANSCLDYLVCELFRFHHPGKPAKPSHRFPIVRGRGAFNKEIGDNALFGIPFEAVAVIESLQPYDGRTDSVATQLKILRALANEHKHRRIHVSVLAASPAPSDEVIPVEKDGELFIMAKDLPRAMHYKAEIGPFSISENGEVKVDGKFTPVVVLEESDLQGAIITLAAEGLCQAVNESCRRLLPFFK